jgi:hypothetical protein
MDEVRQAMSAVTTPKPSDGLYWPPSVPVSQTRQFMKKSLLWWSALLALSVLAVRPAPAFAQKSYAIGVGGGAAIPVGKLADVQKTGYNAIVMLAIGVSDLPFGVRFDGMYNSLSETKSPPTGVTSANLRVSAGIVNLVFAFPGTTAKAYVLAGGGYYNAKADLPGAKSQGDWGFNGGFGATFGFGPFATFFETRYHSVSRKQSEGGVYQFIPVTIGFMF